MSSPQFPAFLWDKGILTTTISDPAYLVQVLFFFVLLMTLVTLLILVRKVNKTKQEQRTRGHTAGMKIYVSW
ncbi:small integral membrane protein 42 [Castor canadensis]|uniref:Small integral membrane protein 42 n=1 Tax=Castor canadensis TaxID=51338 RepID=A0AC58K7I4_CASCN